MVNEKDVWKIHTEAKEKSIVAVREFLEKWKKKLVATSMMSRCIVDLLGLMFGM